MLPILGPPSAISILLYGGFMTLLRQILTAISLLIFSSIAQTTNFERDELIQLNH